MDTDTGFICISSIARQFLYQIQRYAMHIEDQRPLEHCSNRLNKEIEEWLSGLKIRSVHREGMEGPIDRACVYSEASTYMASSEADTCDRRVISIRDLPAELCVLNA